MMLTFEGNVTPVGVGVVGVVGVGDIGVVVGDGDDGVVVTMMVYMWHS